MGLYILHTFSHSPEIFATLDNAAVRCLDIFGRSNDGEGNRVEENARMIGAGLVVGLYRRLVDPDALGGNYFANLE